MKNLKALIGASLASISLVNPAAAVSLHSSMIHESLIPSLQHQYEQHESCSQVDITSLERTYEAAVHAGFNYQLYQNAPEFDQAPIVLNAYVLTRDEERTKEAEAILQGERDEEHRMFSIWDRHYDELSKLFVNPNKLISIVYGLEGKSEAEKEAIATGSAREHILTHREYVSDKKKHDALLFHMPQEVYDQLMIELREIRQKPESGGIFNNLILEGAWKCIDKDEFSKEWSQKHYEERNNWPGVPKHLKSEMREAYGAAWRSLSFDQKLIADLAELAPFDKPYMIFFEINNASVKPE